MAELLKLRAAKQREEIEYEMAKEALHRRWIHAPLAGTVTDVRIEEGEGCEIRQSLVTIVDASVVECIANAPAPVLRRFQMEQPVEILFHYARGNRQVHGKVCYVSPVVDGGSGLGVVKVRVENPDGNILPGTTADIRIPSLIEEATP